MNLTKMANWNKISPQSLINILTGGYVLLPIAKNIKRFFSLKEIVIAVLAIVISVSAGFSVFFYMQKDVVINDGGKQLTFKTMKNTVAEALAQNNISVESYDYVSIPLDASLQRMKTNEINIKRAVPVYIYADGTAYPIMTYADTVGEMLKNSSVRPNSLDKLDGATYEDKIKKDMTVKIVRVNESVVTENEAIPFKTLKRENDRLDSGTERVLKEGREGLRQKQYKVVTEDGKVTSKELLKDFVAAAPINMIMEFGTVLNHTTSRGDVIRYDKVLDMRSTAYTASYSDTGKNPGDPGFGITYTGIRAKKGVIAVDPRVIPLGTRVYVEVAGKTPDYGYAVAADIGGAIKGNLIDLYVDSQSQANNWGVRRVKVYILLDD